MDKKPREIENMLIQKSNNDFELIIYKDPSDDEDVIIPISEEIFKMLDLKGILQHRKSDDVEWWNLLDTWDA